MICWVKSYDQTVTCLYGGEERSAVEDPEWRLRGMLPQVTASSELTSLPVCTLYVYRYACAYRQVFFYNYLPKWFPVISVKAFPATTQSKDNDSYLQRFCVFLCSSAEHCRVPWSTRSSRYSSATKNQQKQTRNRRHKLPPASVVLFSCFILDLHHNAFLHR